MFIFFRETLKDYSDNRNFLTVKPGPVTFAFTFLLDLVLLPVEIFGYILMKLFTS